MWNKVSSKTKHYLLCFYIPIIAGTKINNGSIISALIMVNYEVEMV